MEQHPKQIGENVIALEQVPATEEQLVWGLVTGDARLSSEFFDRFEPKIDRLVWRLLGADTEHADVVQQVFVNIFSSAHQIKDAAVLRGWVNAVTVNTVRREIRSRRYRRLVRPVEGFETSEFSHLEEVSTEDRILVQRFYETLETLSADDRVVLVLRYLEGHTLEEVAQVCKYSLATAKRRIVKAKSAFLKTAKHDSVLGSLLEEGDHES